MKVFVSSACYDLTDLRAELYEELRDLGVDPHFSDIKESDFEIPSEAAINSIEACLADLRECDLVIFVLSQRYGPLLNGVFGEKSATHCEYDEVKKLKKPSLFYVRTDLWGDFSAWRKNGKKAEFKGSWVSSPKDAKGLFGLIEDHINLHGEDGKADSNNWRSTFTTSVDLRAEIRHRLHLQAMHRKAEKLMDAGQVPVITVMTQTVEPVSDSVHFNVTGRIRFKFELANAGAQTAIGIEAQLNIGKGNIIRGPDSVVSVMPPGYDSASQESREVQIEMEIAKLDAALKTIEPQNGTHTIRLVAGYSTTAGHRFADVTFVNLRKDNNRYSLVDAPVYAGKFIEGFYKFELPTPWE